MSTPLPETPVDAAPERADPAFTPRETSVADTRPLTDVCFENFTVHPLLLKGLESAGFVRCTPIQAMTLPLTLEGRDVAGQAQTGTGKTLAFLVTIINRLLSAPARPTRRDGEPRALVLAPTRELAIQIEKDARLITRETGLRFALIYGGVDYDKQRELLKSGTDVVIATPGRIIDYVKQHVVSLASVEIVVLDEADRMFDLGFIKDIRFLLRKMPPREERQSLLFSATLSHRVLELAYEHMNNAVKLTVETENITADRVRQRVYFPSSEEKMPLLIGLLSRMDATRTIVFINTKAWVERVARALERAHFSVGVLSGDVPQSKREKLLAKFKRGELEILVATDVAARGLHIPDVSHVFNFDLPSDAEDYVHRIGRTARLGAEGDAVSFACDRYAISLPDIEAYIDQKIPVEQVEADLLKPINRTPRVVVASTEIEDEADAHIDTKPPPRPTNGRPGDRGRSGPPPRRDGSGPRGPRRDDSRGPRRSEGAGAGSGQARPQRPPRPAIAAVAAVATSPVVVASHTANPAAAGEGAKRRRRRGGRGGAKPAELSNTTAGTTERFRDTQAASPRASTSDAVPLLSRIKQGIKSLFNRLPGRDRQR